MLRKIERKSRIIFLFASVVITMWMLCNNVFCKGESGNHKLWAFQNLVKLLTVVESNTVVLHDNLLKDYKECFSFSLFTHLSRI